MRYWATTPGFRPDDSGSSRGGRFLLTALAAWFLAVVIAAILVAPLLLLLGFLAAAPAHAADAVVGVGNSPIDFWPIWGAAVLNVILGMGGSAFTRATASERTQQESRIVRLETRLDGMTNDVATIKGQNGRILAWIDKQERS